MARLTESDRIRLRYLCDRSFYSFVKIVGGSVKQGADLSPHIHLPLCNLAQNKNVRRKLFLLPRAWRKSTVYTKWRAVWEYLQNHERRILIVSEKTERASEFLGFIEQQFARNEMLRYIYPEAALIDKGWRQSHKWNTLQAECPREGIYSEMTYTATGVLSASQGGHYDMILLDDVTGEKAMRSPIILERALRWFDNCPELLLNPDFNSPDASEISGVATFWSPGDWASYIIDSFPYWQVRIVPALKDDTVKDGGNVKWVQNPDSEVGDTNFPEAQDDHGAEAFSTSYYTQMQADPNLAPIFYTQHQNQPNKATLMTSLDVGWYKYYRMANDAEGRRTLELETDAGTAGDRVSLRDIQLYGLIDPGGFAAKLTKGGSRLAVLVGGQEKGGTRKFVTFTWAGRFKEPDPFLDIVFKAHAEFKPRCWRIDTTGGAQYILRDLQAAARKRGLRDFYISELPSDPTKNSKDEGILAMAEPMTAGEVYIRRDMKELIAETRSYPNSLTKDLIDMCGQMLRCGYWSRRKKTVFNTLFGSNPDADYGRGRSSVTGY